MNNKTAANEYGWNLYSSYTQLPEVFFARVKPEPVRSPKLVVFNTALAKEMGLNADALRGETDAAVFAGNALPEGADPIAQSYAGHQFGHFTMLGDGRALLLGEQMTPDGRRLDVQLKRSGKTPSSRRDDGRAHLAPMLREYLISEAMHALGIPTTRSLAVAATGEAVYRQKAETGAVLTRVASSHIRVGTFQFAAQWGDAAKLKALADYTIARHMPDAAGAANPYGALLKEVIRRQAALVAQWQCAGFIHGVMNTDNVTISGETIDYGPCAFMDAYDPATVFSSIDREGRYAYGNQPRIAGWNLARFAETLLPLLHEDESKATAIAQEAVNAFPVIYRDKWLEGMRRKLGLAGAQPDDEVLISDLLEMMNAVRADYTNTFRALTLGTDEETEAASHAAFASWRARWQARWRTQGTSAAALHKRMRAANPSVIPRNHRVEEALSAATDGDYSPFYSLMNALADPYAYTKEQEALAEKPPSAQGYQTFCGT